MQRFNVGLGARRWTHIIESEILSKLVEARNPKRMFKELSRSLVGLSCR